MKTINSQVVKVDDGVEIRLLPDKFISVFLCDSFINKIAFRITIILYSIDVEV